MTASTTVSSTGKGDLEPGTDSSGSTTSSSHNSPTEEPIIKGREVHTFEELCALASSDSLEKGETVRLIGDMEISQEITFTLPVSFSVEARIGCTFPISVETYESGSINVSVSEGVDTDALDIRFDAPLCDLIWQESPIYDGEESTAELINVSSYNGVDLQSKYALGGRGERKIASFTLAEADNTELETPLSWQISGNTLYLAVSYLTSDSVLKGANAQIVLSDGSICTQPMDLTRESRYTVTDAEGNTRTYKIVTDRITYNLPVFYIDVENGEEVSSREEYLKARLRVDTKNAYGNFPELETSEILIRGRGHYSWKFDKKPYKIRFEEKTSVLGMNASKNWTLIANYTDRSLIQNHVALEMGKVMDNICYHSTQYPVDVFVNGTYRGVYTFGEQLEAKEERIDLEESYTEPDTDYLLEVGGYDEGDIYGRDYFHAGTLKYVSIKHPDSVDLIQEQLDYLIDYVQKADEAVQNLSGYEEYIDIDSLIDWVIIHELTYNLDCCFRRSCYLIKEKDGKLKMGPIWDFDLAFGSFYRYSAGDWATVGEDGGYVGITWMNYLINDSAFMEKFKARWNEIKEPLVTRALTCVNEMGELVAPSAQMNFEIWDILGKSVPSQPSSHKKYDTYEKMLSRLSDFIKDRYNWLDTRLNK